MGLLAIVLASVLAASAACAAPKPPVHRLVPGDLDALFGALAKAQSEEEAKPLEDKTLAAFFHSNSPTVDLLMLRAAAALHGGAGNTARKLIAAVTNVAPDYAEGWHQRAEILADAGDDQGAMFCLQKTITLNPRQFEALTELAGLIEEYGDKQAALRLYRRALALDPYFDDVARKVRALTHEVEGQSL